MAKIYWDANLLDFTFIGDIESPLNWKGFVAPGPNDIAVLGAEAGEPYSVTSNPGLLALLDLGSPAVETLYGLQTASNVTLGLTGNVSLLGLLQQDTVLYLSHGTAGGVNAGTIDIKNAVLDTGIPIVGTLLDSLLGASATLEISGTFDNKGTVILDQQPHLLSILGAPYQSTYLVVAGGAELIGGGHITLTDENLNFITGTTASSFLENVDNIISGAGQLGSGKMTFINEAGGVVDATGVNALIFNTGNVTSTNAGLMEGTGAGGLIILDSTINNSGGTISAGAGSAVVLTSAHISGGTLTTVGSGVVETSNLGSTLSDATNEGTIVIQRATSLTISGAIKNTGTIDDTGAAAGHYSNLIVSSAGATLTGRGVIAMKFGRFYGASAASVLTNVDNLIGGEGLIGSNRLTFINEARGVVDADAGGHLTLQASGGVTNTGILEATKGILVIDSAVDNMGGLIKAQSGGAVYLEDATVTGGTLQAFGAGLVGEIKGSALDDVTIVGRLRAYAKTDLTLQGTITNSGLIAVAGAAAAPTSLVISGAVTLTGGGVVDSSNSTFNRIVSTSAATLTNMNNKFGFVGTIGSADLTVINEAAGFIHSTAGKLIIDTGANTIQNAGVIEGIGGGVVIDSALDNTGRLEAFNGSVTVTSAVTGGGDVLIANGTATFGAAFAENVIFLSASTKGSLVLADSADYTGTVYKFSKTGTNSLDLADIGFGSGSKATYSGTAFGGLLSVTDGTSTANIKLAGNYLGSTFELSSDGHGGTKVIDPTEGKSGTAAGLTNFVSAMATFGGSSAGDHVTPNSLNFQTTLLATPNTNPLKG